MESTTAPSRDENDRWQHLLHRWFVQYNPIYLLSAALVLGGVILISRGLAQEGSNYGSLGVAAIAEAYACALIAGAAVLMRQGQRRPAVLLALITALYQADLTLHTETCAYLGTTGRVAALSWLALFVGKLVALAWALRIRLTSRALATAVIGAAGLALGPHVVPFLDPKSAGVAMAFFVFALGSLHPGEGTETAVSGASTDAWARTVLRRSVRFVWALWGAALGVHLLFWSAQRPIALGYVVLAVAFLALGRVGREARVWVGVGSLLLGVLLVAPTALSACALLAALLLVRRAFERVPVEGQPIDGARTATPYRTSPAPAGSAAASFVPVDAASRARLLAGALLGAYLSAWLRDYCGGDLPVHVLSLDLVLAASAGLMAWRLRSRLPFAPVGAAYTHGVLVSGVIPFPRSLLGLGGTAVGLGFVLLFGSIAVSWRHSGSVGGRQ